VSLVAAGLQAQATGGSAGLGAPVWIAAEAKATRVERHLFESAAAKTKVSYHLYAPEAYARETGRRFPVIYWLHGSGGGRSGIPRVAAHFDAAMAAGKTRRRSGMITNLRPI
jgi:poly(3-hydroxybutyrate) depolymerase